MAQRNKLLTAVGALMVGGLYASAVVGSAEFGAVEDVEYAATLWQALDDANLVGDRLIHGTFNVGVEPAHGFVLETFFGQLTLDGVTAPVIVMRNYGPESVTVDEVSNNPRTT